MKKQYQLAIIGCGQIAPYHVEAARAAGMQVAHCAGRKGSKTVRTFGEEQGIPKVWEDPKQLLNNAKNWDGVIIAASVEAMPSLLRRALATEKPILIEKPVFIGKKGFDQFKTMKTDQVMVGYNRRFYKTIGDIKNFVGTYKKPLSVKVQIPESINAGAAQPFKPVFENSCHMIDLLFYIFGDLTVKHIEKIKHQRNLIAIHTTLRSRSDDLIFVDFNFNASANFGLIIDAEKTRLEATPIEEYRLFSGLNVTHPTKDYPIRKYEPRLTENFVVFDTERSGCKPGFLQQAVEFRKLIEGIQPKIASSFIDAEKVQSTIEKITIDV